MTESGFDLGLQDPARAGVFFVTADDLALLRAAAHDAGLPPRHIDLLGCHNKATLLLRMALALDFPTSSGRNWDALSDNLRDLQWLPGTGHVLLFEAANELHDNDPSVFDTLVSILDEASGEWKARGFPFWAFLALPERDYAKFDD